MSFSFADTRNREKRFDVSGSSLAATAIDRQTIEFAFMATVIALGHYLLGHFEERTPKWRKVAKLLGHDLRLCQRNADLTAVEPDQRIESLLTVDGE